MPTWLPIALMFASAFANKKGQDKVEDEREGRMAAERIRQQQLGDESRARLDQTMATQERPAIEQSINESTADRTRKYETAVPQDAATDYVVNPSAPKEVRSEISREMVDALGRGRQQSKALAKLGGRSDTQFDSNVTLGRSAGDVSQIGNFSRGSSGVLPFELEGARGAGHNWRTLADLFQLGSMGAGFYGMSTVPTQAAAPVKDVSRASAAWGA